jgi:hypothetical protein
MKNNNLVLTGGLQALFNLILTRDETQREKAIEFIKEKIIPLREELINPNEEIQKLVADNVKKVCQTSRSKNNSFR